MEAAHTQVWNCNWEPYKLYLFTCDIFKKLWWRKNFSIKVFVLMDVCVCVSVFCILIYIYFIAQMRIFQKEIPWGKTAATELRYVIPNVGGILAQFLARTKKFCFHGFITGLQFFLTQRRCVCPRACVHLRTCLQLLTCVCVQFCVCIQACFSFAIIPPPPSLPPTPIPTPPAPPSFRFMGESQWSSLWTYWTGRLNLKGPIRIDFIYFFCDTYIQHAFQ